jgi:hypothetical protein
MSRPTNIFNATRRSKARPNLTKVPHKHEAAVMGSFLRKRSDYVGDGVALAIFLK